MTKKITKKTIEIFEQEYEALLVTESEWDGQRAMAYHCVTGLLVGDWMNLVREYCERSGRKHFFGINNTARVPCALIVSQQKNFRRSCVKSFGRRKQKFLNWNF